MASRMSFVKLPVRYRSPATCTSGLHDGLTMF
jgi:hypothetical protein